LDAITTLLEEHYIYAIIALLGLQLLLIFLIWHNYAELRGLKGRLKRLIDTGSGYDLAELLEKYRNMGEIQNFLEQLQEKMSDLQVSLEGSFSRWGMVRFNAFKDVSGDLSYALALLTREGNGFIITSLYSRDESRTFIKTVLEGRATVCLSEEEEKALATALGLVDPEK
jgi:hypothetical protein